MSTRTESLEAVYRHEAFLEEAKADRAARDAQYEAEAAKKASYEIKDLIRSTFGLTVSDLEVANKTFSCYTGCYERIRTFAFTVDGYKFDGEFVSSSFSISGANPWTKVLLHHRRWTNLSLQDLKTVLEGKYSFTVRDRIRAYFNSI